jgi:DNA segregation ATPase FtsK/SpoIIIE-like protein
MMHADQGDNVPARRTVRRWQLQSEEISNALSSSGFDEEAISGTVNADSWIYTIRGRTNEGITMLRTAVQELANSLNLEGLRAKIVNDYVQLQIPRSEDVAVPLLDLLARHDRVPDASAALGLSEDGSTVFHDFGSRDTPHLVVTGGENAGKTVILRTIAVSLAINNRQSDIQLAAICPTAAAQNRQREHAAAWLPLNYLPHMICDVAEKHTEIVKLLDFLSQEVNYREQHAFRKPRLIILIDQADVLLARGGRQCAQPLLHLAQRGDSVGVHLVLSAQSLETPVVSMQLRSELPVQLIGKPQFPSKPESELPTIPDNDAELLLGEGDFLHSRGNRIHRLQGAFIDDYDLHMKLTQMYRQRAILLAKPLEMRLRLNSTQDGAALASWPPNDMAPLPTPAT